MLRRSRVGFTLVELLVVVSIIVLLISVLLPSLQKAKGQAKITVCQSNVSQIGRVLISYFLDLNRFPILSTDYAKCTWSYGGWSGKNREFWESFGATFNIQTNRRPLTTYGVKSGLIPEEADRLTPTQEAPLYRCPADRISAQWQWGSTDVQNGLSAYDDVGTSYQMNWSWWPQTDVGNWSWSYRAGTLGVRLWSRQYYKNASRFLALFEDPCDLALNTGCPCDGPPSEGSAGIQTLGFHGRFSNHVVLCLDSHAQYRYLDTRHTHDSLPVPPISNRHGPLSVMGDWTAVEETSEHVAGGRHLPN